VLAHVDCCSATQQALRADGGDGTARRSWPPSSPGASKAANVSERRRRGAPARRCCSGGMPRPLSETNFPVWRPAAVPSVDADDDPALFVEGQLARARLPSSGDRLSPAQRGERVAQASRLPAAARSCGSAGGCQGRCGRATGIAPRRLGWSGSPRTPPGSSRCRCFRLQPLRHELARQPVQQLQGALGFSPSWPNSPAQVDQSLARSGAIHTLVHQHAREQRMLPSPSSACAKARRRPVVGQRVAFFLAHSILRLTGEDQ